MKRLLIGLTLLVPLLSFGADISYQYQDIYGDKACMVFHFKHDRAEVFELVTKPLFWGIGSKVFRAVENFEEKNINIEKGNFDQICSNSTRVKKDMRTVFTCNNTGDKFTVIYKEDRTISDVIFNYNGKTYQCLNLMAPFDAN